MTEANLERISSGTVTNSERWFGLHTSDAP